MKLKVKPKAGKVTFFHINNPQEGMELARGLFAGMKCKIIYDDRPEKSTGMRTGTTNMYKPDMRINQGGVDRSSPYKNYITSISDS